MGVYASLPDFPYSRRHPLQNPERMPCPLPRACSPALPLAVIGLNAHAGDAVRGRNRRRYRPPPCARRRLYGRPPRDQRHRPAEHRFGRRHRGGLAPTRRCWRALHAPLSKNSEKEAGRGMSQATPVFRLPSAFFVHRSAGVTSLTSAQLADVYSGKVSELEGCRRPGCAHQGRAPRGCRQSTLQVLRQVDARLEESRHHREVEDRGDARRTASTPSRKCPARSASVRSPKRSRWSFRYSRSMGTTRQTGAIQARSP